MMLTWMFSALLFGACVTLVATAAQPFAKAMGRPSRWIWSVALAVAALWPVLSTIALFLLPSLSESATRLSSIRVMSNGAALLPDVSAAAIRLASRVALVLWAIATLFLGVRLGRSLALLRRMRDAADRSVVDGVEVLVSNDSGPATIGLRRHSVLLPRTMLDLEEPLRQLVLRHECEHRAAHDPWLLLAASVAVMLFPWNLALWSIARRLRFALEIDCDARVLAAGADPVRYGRLLLLLAQRQPAVSLALPLATPRSQLERRIIAMRTRLVRPRLPHLFLAGTALVLGIAGACSAGAPDVPATRASSRASGTPVVVAKDTPMYEFQVEAQARQLPGTGSPHYPRAMKEANREGEVLAQFVVDERGNVDVPTFKVLKSTDPAFTEAVHEALPTLRFAPAKVGGRAVRQVVQQPFTFGLARN
jgi:TonB family protein